MRTGLWHWEAPHPDWSGPENEALRRRLAATAETPSKVGVVSSYAIDNGDQLLLFDPLLEVFPLQHPEDQALLGPQAA